MTDAPPTVLIIDDEPQIRRFLKAGFDLELFTVLEEETGKAGMRTATLRQVDLIVLDLNLPDVDGASVVERIRAWSEVPIIVLSVRASDTDKVKLLEAGDEIVAVDDIYGGSFRLFTHVYEKFGVKVRYVDATEPQNLLPALSPKTKLVWIETPTNPTLKIADIQAISRFAQAAGALLVVDNTFASPALQRPLTLGADIVIHSATKYLGGHSDLIAGLLAVKDPELGARLKFLQNASGNILGPWDSWLVIRGIETLHLRVEAHCRNAQAVAQALTRHPAVEKVFYPGLPTHNNHEVAARQQSGFGGIVSFTLKDDSLEAARAVTTATRLFKLAESLGGVKSLICHPAAMTHKSIPREKRLAAGVNDSLIRLSCGIENAGDLVSDIRAALDKYFNIDANHSISASSGIR